jgi:hypothetical protein
MGVSTLKRYASTDGSAPRVAGTAGDVTSLLDLILNATGYGSQTPVSPAWTIDKTGTNKRVYKQGAGCQFGYRINDAAAGTGGAKEALIRGAEVWTDIDTVSSGPFPTNAQSALTNNSLVMRKSVAADTTARVWKIFADSRTCYIFVQTGDLANTYFPSYFGDMYSYTPSDPYAASIHGRASENSAAVTSAFEGPAIWTSLMFTTTWSTTPGSYAARSDAGTGGSVPLVRYPGNQLFNMGGAQHSGITGNLNYPNRPDGGLRLSRLYVGDLTTGSTQNERGWMRGLWGVCHPHTNFADGDTVIGTGVLAGRTFEIIKILTAASQSYAIAVETSATVEYSL